MGQANAVATMDDMGKIALSLVKSKLFGFDTVEQAMAIMLIAQAEGRSPALAARDYHVIQGRPALKADAMLARFQQAGGVVEWDVYTDEKVSGRFSHPRSSPKPIAIEWTFDMARKIGLANKDNWKKYPRAMMRARVISEGVRTVYPGIAVGVYTIEEVQDFEEKDITPDSRKATAGFLGMQPVKRQEQIIEIATGIKSYMANDQTADAYALWQDSKLDNEETIAMWSLLDSKIRGALGALHTAEQAHQAGTISPAQKKRLEARIHEQGLSRDTVKGYCTTLFQKEHFADLTTEEYRELDEYLDKAGAKEAAAQERDRRTGVEANSQELSAENGSRSGNNAATEQGENPHPDAAAPTLTADQAIANIGKATDADTLSMAADLAREVCKTAPEKAGASAAYRKRLTELRERP